MRARNALKTTAALAAVACTWIAVVWALSYRYVGVVHLLRSGPDGQVMFALESDAGRFALVRETRRITAVGESTTWTRTGSIGVDPDDAVRGKLYLNTLGAPGAPQIGIASFGDDFTAGVAVRYHVPFLTLAFVGVGAVWRLLIASVPVAVRPAAPDDDPSAPLDALTAPPAPKPPAPPGDV